MPKHRTGYESLLKEIVDTVKNSQESLSHAIETSEKVAEAASDMTKDELAIISAYIRADLQEFATNYHESQSGHFAVMIMNSVWEGLASITDRSALEWAELAQELEHQGIYQAGEMIGLGELQCEKCGHKAEYNHPTEIIPCIACGHKVFHRVTPKSHPE
ncbi:hypothetical protein VA7868_02160 [Vibrio aerogenes CECT 7868]|uniref:Zinc ribbon-containing protein n=1 Tax=Vibrio aerogenes CECT 7868 TaxID=1216006 RepID=A0A1M5Z0T6_9VIBR|nr:hypothetical protein [Vibrio aerogenes]SHI17902.1 hypothetical protein VA7868_02160 [Vibrio aerogenes CECT 7868]